jgi:hypothetical protein
LLFVHICLQKDDESGLAGLAAEAAISVLGWPRRRQGQAAKIGDNAVGNVGNDFVIEYHVRVEKQRDPVYFRPRLRIQKAVGHDWSPICIFIIETFRFCAPKKEAAKAAP